MLNRKEFLNVLGVTIVLGIIISLLKTWDDFFITTLLVFGVILVNIAFKKIMGYYLDTEVEIKNWEWSRWGYKKHQHFKKQIPAGIIMPLVIKFVSVGLVNWMAVLTFDVKGKVYRAAKRMGIYSFSEISEREIGWIASAGIWANVGLALISYLIGGTILLQFAKLNLLYAFFNVIPISTLDGSKLFFGSKMNWTLLAIITSIGVLSTFMIV